MVEVHQQVHTFLQEAVEVQDQLVQMLFLNFIMVLQEMVELVLNG